MDKSLDKNLNKMYESLSRDHDELTGKLMDSLPTEGISISRAVKVRQFIGDIIMENRISKAAVAAVIIIAAVTGINYFGSSFDGTTIAWADVIEPIMNAKAVIYTTVIGEEGKNPEIRDMVMGSRIRRTMSGLEDISIIDLETMRILSIDPVKKKATFIDMKGLPDIPKSQLEQFRNIISQLQNSPHFEVEELGQREIDGRELIGFSAKHPQQQMTIWADPDTGVPVRMEVEGGQLSIVCKDFEFDIEMDKSLFSMEVPQGYTLRETQLDLMGSTEEDFIEGLRIMAGILGDGQFPDDVSVEHFVRISPKIEPKFDELGLSDDQQHEIGMKLQRHLMFIRFFKGQGKWYYAGKNVKLGDSETGIFWYRPRGSKTYRLIYGDLSVADVAEQDLPAPVEKTPKVVLKYQQWDKDNFVGFERDIWHITADGQILAESIINIRKGPVDKDIMTITLPYGGGQLESVTLADANLPFNKITDRRYEIQLPLEKLFEGKTSIKCTWTMPFDSLEQAETGLRTILRSLIPVGSYRLIIALDTDCGYQFSSDAQKRRKLVFSWNSSEKTKGYFGSCGIPIRKIE